MVTQDKRIMKKKKHFGMFIILIIIVLSGSFFLIFSSKRIGEGLYGNKEQKNCVESFCVKYNINRYEDCILVKSESGFFSSSSTEYYSCLVDEGRVEMQKGCVEYLDYIDNRVDRGMDPCFEVSDERAKEIIKTEREYWGYDTKE